MGVLARILPRLDVPDSWDTYAGTLLRRRNWFHG